MSRTLTITTHCDFSRSPDTIWLGITNATMTVSRPFCFHLGIPLPRKCEITRSVDGIGTERRCTSDKGHIDQVISDFSPNRRLAFALASHDLRTAFAIGHMDDEFLFAPLDGGRTRLTRTTRIEVPDGAALWFRCWAIGQSIRNVHRNIQSS
jgi:hypothetical protein